MAPFTSNITFEEDLCWRADTFCEKCDAYLGCCNDLDDHSC